MLPQASIVDTKETLYNVQSKAIGENCKWIFVPAHVSDEWTGSSALNSTRFRPRKISTSHHRIISKFADQIIQKLMYSIPKSRFRSDHAGNELRIRQSMSTRRAENIFNDLPFCYLLICFLLLFSYCFSYVPGPKSYFPLYFSKGPKNS